MTFVGKVLVVVQLVLSICFMAFAGAVYTFQTKWRAQYEAEAKSKSEIQAQFNALDTQRQKRENLAKTILDGDQIPYDAGGDIVEQSLTAFEAKVQEANDLATEKRTAEAALAAKNTEYEALESRLIISEQETALASESADAADTRSSLLESLNFQAQDRLGQQESALRSTEDDLFAVERDLDEIQRRYDELLSESARLRRLLINNDIDPDSQPESRDAPPPAVDGIVLATKKTRSSELVEISIGSDDGLKNNDTLFVFRTEDSKYLGQIKLVLVTPDRAVGTVTERAKNGVIQKGDNVATKL